MVIPGLSLGPCCCSCLSCDRLSGSPRAPGLRGLDENSVSLGEVGQPRGFLLRLCWAFCCCCPTLGPIIRGSARAWRLLFSPLSSKSLQQPVPRRGSQRTQKIRLPSLGTQGLSFSISVSKVGVCQRISALGGPQALSPLFCTGSRSCSLPPLSPRGVRDSGRVDSARVGHSMDAEPHSPAWEQQHCWHQGDDLAAVSVVLSPKL